MTTLEVQKKIEDAVKKAWAQIQKEWPRIRARLKRARNSLKRLWFRLQPPPQAIEPGLIKKSVIAQSRKIALNASAKKVKKTIADMTEAHATREFFEQQYDNGVLGLIDGALQAFRETPPRPENLHILISHDEETRLQVLRFLKQHHATGPELALAARGLTDETMRQDFLNQALVDHVKDGHLSFVAALLEAGAKANANQDQPLRTAAYSGDTEKVDLLFRNGANFDNALFHAQVSGSRSTVARLELYRRKFMGQPTESAAVTDTLQRLQEEIAALKLKFNAPASPAAPPPPPVPDDAPVSGSQLSLIEIKAAGPAP